MFIIHLSKLNTFTYKKVIFNEQKNEAIQCISNKVKSRFKKNSFF